MTPPSCSGPCEQGKKPCPCPQSCQQPDNAPSNGLFYLCLAVLIVWIVAVVIAPMFAGYFLEITK